jgi:ABC-2 type transport system ATP-binding protein
VAAITVQGLRKRYGDLEAVRGISFEVAEGDVYALLGPNGAGKTTTVEILEGFRRRTAGQVSVLGRDPSRRERALRERIGIVLQSTGVDPYLTVEETVELYRGYYPNPRPLDEIIEVVGLREKRRARVNKLSGGQQRRLDVAVALAGDPDLLFLDEPTTGFDPGARRNAWGVVKNLAELGKTVFLTTHYMDEAQYLADTVAIIARGEIVAEGPPSSLGGRDTAATTIAFALPAGSGDLPPALRTSATVADGRAVVRTDDPTRTLHELTGWALQRDVRLDDLSVSRPSLEDVYLEITGREEGPE